MIMITAKLPCGFRVLQVVFGRGREAEVCRREEFTGESDSSGADTKRMELPCKSVKQNCYATVKKLFTRHYLHFDLGNCVAV